MSAAVILLISTVMCGCSGWEEWPNYSGQDYVTVATTDGPATDAPTPSSQDYVTVAATDGPVTDAPTPSSDTKRADPTSRTTSGVNTSGPQSTTATVITGPQSTAATVITGQDYVTVATTDGPVTDAPTPSSQDYVTVATTDGPATDAPTPSSTVVAFTAKLNIADSYPSKRGVLKFRDVPVNQGNGYSPRTGVFTCPRGGFYHFAAHLSVYGTAQFGIYKNGEVVVSIFDGTHDAKRDGGASVSSVVQLSRGDEVWVSVWGPGRNGIYASEDSHSVFVGFYLG